MKFTSLWLLATSALPLLVNAHGDGDGDGHASVIPGDVTYTELHMAQEHHMDSFDIQSFFHLHDLNRDGILDVNELESIYGVHHEKAKKGAKSVEVHTQQAKEIVAEVLKRLDTDGDGFLTMREFVAGGVGGLPNFVGVEDLGHHYDPEGEYFLHHEEKYHNTPETQGEESYIHPEDIEHFMAHDQIEQEEAERVREFQGLPSEDSSESIHDPDHAEVPQDILLGNFKKEAEEEHERLLAEQNSGATTGGQIPMVAPRKKKKVKSTEPDSAASKPPPSSGERPLSSEEKKRQERAEFARAQARKFGKDVKEASRRGEWGSGESAFKRPKDPADRLRKNVPYKFKMKKSFWGEF